MTASAASARHEIRALLRAHLSAATSYRHVTRHCPICHRLERLALETSSAASAASATSAAQGGCEGGCEGCEPDEDESPPNA
ncbi:DUF6274 family protein [Streptomyces sp. BA2]|uniref:DUF6274 family protein n=1 Tax=Streptomyces sp. BA2 TaxID=436595 RepID=UPI001326CC62|nr:DUF6274 family protein [Streptomyces sp. BA2]MWA12145.1 hypothetical protein [Streptomyces sp. BA2]